MNVRIAPLTAADIDELVVLAREIWRAHYPPIIGSEQTEYMLAQRYDPEVIRRELDDADIEWHTLRRDGRMIGFASCFPDPENDAMKLDKLYVHPEHQRRGYGAMLMDHVAACAARRGCPRLVLAVNKRNASAIAAYEKHGFRVVDAAVKDIGGGFVMDDYIMARES